MKVREVMSPHSQAVPWGDCGRHSADSAYRTLKFNSIKEGKRVSLWFDSNVVGLYFQKDREKKKLTQVGSFPEVLQRHPAVADVPRKQGARSGRRGGPLTVPTVPRVSFAPEMLLLSNSVETKLCPRKMAASTPPLFSRVMTPLGP